MDIFRDMYDGIIDGMKEPEKETTEGKVPTESDKEDTKIQKLTEDEAIVKAGSRVTSSDGTKKGAVIALAKDDPSIGIVKWDDTEAEIPVSLANLKVEEAKIKEDFAEEHGLGKAEKAEPKKEAEPEKDAAVVEPVDEPTKEETPTITKEYIGKSEDTHFYLISKDAATGEREDLEIVDQEGIQKYSAKANNIDLSKVDDFIISAIQDVNIDQIERSIFVKYLLPRIEKEEVVEQPEIEKEEAPEELGAKEKPEEKPEEEKPTESKKVNEVIKSFEIMFHDLNDEAKKKYLEFAGIADPEKENVDLAPLAIVDLEMEECRTCGKKATKKMKKESTEVKEDVTKREIKVGDEIIWDIWPGKVVGEGSDQGKPVWKVILHGKKRDMPFDIPKGDDELRLAEGKVPAESDKEDTKIKKLIETKITDEEGNEFEVALVDDGTEDTVIDVNGREFRFSNDFAGLWRDEAGNLSDEGLKELALDALANLEDDIYNELVGVGKAQVDAKAEAEEGGVVGEQSMASEMETKVGEEKIN